MTKINIAVDDGLPIPEAPPVTRAERPGFSSISFLRKLTVEFERAGDDLSCG